MVTVNASSDGHQYQTYNTVDLVPTTEGVWQNVVYTTVYTGANETVVRCGYYAGRRYTTAIVFDALAIDPGDSIATATLTLTLAGCISGLDLTVRAYLDEDTPGPSASYFPSNQVKTTAYSRINTVSDANYDSDADYWVPATNPLVIDIKDVLQECVNHSSWQNTGKLVVVLRATTYQDTNNGSIGIDATEAVLGTAAYIDYTLTNAPTISSVSTDDIVLADESSIVVAGTNLSGASALRIFKGTASYPQTIDTNTATAITFNIAGNVPVGTGYSLEVTIDQETVTKTIEVRDSAVQGGGTTESVSDGVALSAVDGHEYEVFATGFPGTWETQSSVTSTGFFTSGLMIGKQNSNTYKASIKFGPITADNSDTLLLAELRLNVLRNYKLNDFRIKAVADPDAADIGASNIISSQTLTTAEVSVDNSSWANVNSIGNWVQTVNPKPIDITSVIQEVVNHANWSSGDYVQVIIDHSGSVQGNTRLYSNDDSAGNASTLYYSIDNGPSITSVSSDNIIEMGELSCTIVGLNLSSASNLNINKGGISENQTISSNTSTSIVFDVTTGAIVVDTGYTLQFDIGGTTYTTTVEFVTGGGVNSGTVSTTADGYEYGATLPSSGSPGTFAEQSASGNLLYIGKPVGLSIESMATARIGPISAQRGQTFTQADFTWNIPSAGRNYKYVNFNVQAVADPTVGELSASELITSQTLTTAAVAVQTSTWAGASGTSTWLPGAEVIDISTVVTEVVSDSGWTTGSYIQLVFTPTAYPSGSAVAAFGSEEGGDNPSFSYATAAATNLANINGNNIIRTGDTGVVLSGSDLSSATALTITDGTYTESQTIDSNTATAITFDFTQGSLGYGAATLAVTIGGIAYTFDCTLSPAVGKSYVTLGATVSTGDAALTYNDSPALITGDIIEYDQTSGNGFPVTLAVTGIPTITGGAGQDTFTVRGYDASTGIWYDDQTATFLESSYFVVNKIPTLVFAQTNGGFAIVNNDAGEDWVLQDDSDSGEIWT